jgi:hypothetical protein
MGLLLQDLVFDLLEHAVRIVEVERGDLLRTDRNPDKHNADRRVSRVTIVPDVETAGPGRDAVSPSRHLAVSPSDV